MNDNFDEKLTELGAQMLSNVSYEPKFNIPAKKRRISTKALIIAAIVFTLLSSITVIAANPYNIFSKEQHKGLFIASERHVVKMNLGKMSRNEVDVEVVLAVPTSDRVIIYLKYTGLENREYNKVANGIYIESNNNRHYESNLNLFTGQSVLQQEDGNILEMLEFDMVVMGKQKVSLVIPNIEGIDGEWKIEFELMPTETHIYNLEKEYPIGEGTLYVKKITIDAISTTIEYSIKGYIPANHHMRWYSNKVFEYQGYTGGNGINSQIYPPEEDYGWYRIITTFEPVPYDVDKFEFCVQSSIAPREGILAKVEVKLNDEDRIIIKNNVSGEN